MRAPTPSAAAEMVVAAKEEFAPASTGRRGGCARRIGADSTGGAHALHVLAAAAGWPAFPARLAMRGRHAAELTHQLRGAIARR